MFRRFVPAIAMLTVAGCAGPETAAPEEARETARVTAPLTVDHEAVLVFQGDWSTVQKNLPLMAGGRLRVDFTMDRLRACRATYNGLATWDVVVNYRLLPETTIKQAALPRQEGIVSTTLPLPETTQKVELWFVNTDRAGCRAVDSNQGQNYVFDVARPGQLSTATFGSDWKQAVSAPITRGGLVRIDYAPERLRACRGSYHGGRMWNIYAGWRFQPGDRTGTVALYDGDYFGGEAAITKPDVFVPEDATSVEFWFSNSDSWGCTAWDSNFADNYDFDVQAPGTAAPVVRWGGDFDYVLFHREKQHLGDVDPAYSFDSMGGAEVAPSVELQIWAPGVTDKTYATAQALNAAVSRVKAEAVTDALGTATAWGTTALRFVERRGNNFVYAFDLMQLRGPVNHAGEGLFHWYARFAIDGGAAVDVGHERADGRRLVLAAQQNANSCALFPDHAPQGCPQARVVGWAGTWGGRFTHACDHVGAIADPVVFAKSGGGHDCMVIDAEVWVQGLTDRAGDPAGIKAEIETDMGFTGGPLATPVTYALGFDGRVGNNYRFKWDAGGNVGRVERGDYKFRFRFSGDGGATWYVIGKGDGPTGGDWRKVLVRNDSSDVPAASHCDDVQLWQGVYNSFPACFNYDLAQNFDATHCEFFLNALGNGRTSHNGVGGKWIEAYLKVGPQDGNLLNVGMLTRHRVAGALKELWTQGTQLEPGYWLVGVTYERTAPVSSQSFVLDVQDFAFFVDVRRPDGQVVRLWQSNGGGNFSLREAYPESGYAPYDKSIGTGTISYANEGLPMFGTRHSCGF